MSLTHLSDIGPACTCGGTIWGYALEADADSAHATAVCASCKATMDLESRAKVV